MFYNENNFFFKLYFCLIRCRSPPALPRPCPPGPCWPPPPVLPPPLLAPPTPCFTGLSLLPPPKTLHREREPMGLRQRGNESEMTSEKKK